MNDDSPGCPTNSSEVRFVATAGRTYLIAVHGSGSATGTYTLSLFCQGACSPATSNDNCATAATVNPVLADGTGIPQTFDNTCAYVDNPTSVSGALPAVGLWYTD